MQTLHEAADAIRAGRVTPLDLVEQCLAAVDRWESRVHAWVFVDRDGARAEARRLGDELARGQYRGPLHGIPIGVKDIFDVFDWPTAAGSKRWANSIARADAMVVKQLRQAGCVFLGKTVTTQYASFDPPATRNPWNLDRTPGGSSSGSAAAVATGMCLGAVGSQTGGSITRPASYCGVAGMKPTYGSVSLSGVVPLARSMDHPGPMARCVRDLAILFQKMVGYGPDSEDSDYVGALGVDNPPRLNRVLGLFEDLAEPAVRDMVRDVADRLARAGAGVAQFVPPPAFAEVLPRHRTVMAVEAAVFHETRLHRHPDDYLPNVRQLLEEGLACPAPEYARCKEHQEELGRTMGRVLREGGVLLAPATTGPAPDAATTGSPAFNSPWSYVGLPVVSLPTGHFVDGLPLAIQLIAERHAEANLLRVAAWCERALGIVPLAPPPG